MGEYVVCAYCGRDDLNDVQWFTYDGVSEHPVCNDCAVEHKDEVYPIESMNLTFYSLVRKVKRLEKCIIEIVTSVDCNAWTPELLSLIKELNIKKGGNVGN